MATSGVVGGPEQEISFVQWLEARYRLCAFVALAGAILWTLLYFQFTVDDAFISFRYAKVFVANHIWNWNPSGDRVESYTSASYTALAIVPAALHLPVALFFKGFGLLCIAAMVYRLWTKAGSRFALILGLLLMGLSPWLWLHAYSGLETPFYMLLLLEMAICVKEAPSAKSPYICALFLLLPLTRPEGVVFAVAGAIMFWYRRGSAPKYVPYFGLAGVAGVLYFVARWKYFHDFLPNPFYVKVAHSSLHELVANLATNLSWSRNYVLTLVLVLLLARKSYTRVFAFCGLLLIFVLFEPHKMQMNYADRFYFQMSFPIVLFFLIAEDVARIARLACIVTVLALISISSKELIACLPYFPYLQQAHVDLGKRLAPFAKGHTLLIGDDGAVPYYSNWVTYDFLGLCTNSVAKQGINLPLLRQMHPDLIVVYSNHPGAQVEYKEIAAQEVVLDYVRSSGEYEYAGASRWQDFYLVSFLKKDTPQHDEILHALQQNTESSAKMHFSMKKVLLQKYVPWTG